MSKFSFQLQCFTLVFVRKEKEDLLSKSKVSIQDSKTKSTFIAKCFPKLILNPHLSQNSKILNFILNKIEPEKILSIHSHCRIHNKTTKDFSKMISKFSASPSDTSKGQNEPKPRMKMVIK